MNKSVKKIVQKCVFEYKDSHIHLKKVLTHDSIHFNQAGSGTR